MFGLKKKGPDKAFSHAFDCKILAADPDTKIEWSEIERGHWRAVCRCGSEEFYEPVDGRVRQDPLDVKTSRHVPQCSYVDETDLAVLRLLLKVTDGSGGDYWWVQCGGCDCGWPVAYYAAESIG
jgi:hypothetical protein